MVAIARSSRVREGFKRWLRWNDPNPRVPRLVSTFQRYLSWSRATKFDVELRYAVVAEFLHWASSGLGVRPTVLDAGSGPLGLASYLRRECVGLDVVFPSVPAENGYLLRVRGSVTQLPFRDASFDLVASMDTLEHLPAVARPMALREMFRVASRALVVGVPYGARAAAYDRWAQAIERARGAEPDWRREHVANGLPGPELDEVVSSLVAERGARLLRKKHENLRLLRLRWRIALAIPQSHFAYGLLMGPLNAVARRFHFGSCYRRTYFIEFPQGTTAAGKRS